jgi:hypothetical protein
MKRKVYMKKPEYVEAIQFDGTNGWEVSNLMYGEGNEVQWKIWDDMMCIAGDMIIQKGMYVMRVDGGVMLMNESAFKKNFVGV